MEGFKKDTPTDTTGDVVRLPAAWLRQRPEVVVKNIQQLQQEVAETSRQARECVFRLKHINKNGVADDSLELQQKEAKMTLALRSLLAVVAGKYSESVYEDIESASSQARFFAREVRLLVKELTARYRYEDTSK